MFRTDAVTLLVASGLVNGVALGALGFEDLLARLLVSLGRLRPVLLGRHRRRSTPNPSSPRAPLSSV